MKIKFAYLNEQERLKIKKFSVDDILSYAVDLETKLTFQLSDIVDDTPVWLPVELPPSIQILVNGQPLAQGTTVLPNGNHIVQVLNLSDTLLTTTLTNSTYTVAMEQL